MSMIAAYQLLTVVLNHLDFNRLISQDSRVMSTISTGNLINLKHLIGVDSQIVFALPTALEGLPLDVLLTVRLDNIRLLVLGLLNLNH